MRNVLFALVVVSGCGDQQHHNGDGGPDGPADAYVTPQCWRDQNTPGGSVQLGTGINGYVPMPDTITLEYGTQASGYDMPVNAMINGLMPGNVNDPLAPGNPRTRFRAYFLDTTTPCGPGDACADPMVCFNSYCLTPTTPGHCGASVGYLPAPGDGGDYVLYRAVPLPFDYALQQADLQGKQMMVTVEVVDALSHYAIDQKLVTLDAPAH